MGALPVNFETKIKEAKAVNGGYPYSIKAEDLMKNFVDAKLEVDETVHDSGLQLEEYLIWGENGHKGRGIRINPDSVASSQVLHDWKVTLNAEDPLLMDIAGGTVYHETGTIVVSAKVGVTPQDRFLLRITRDSTPRVVTEAEVFPYSSAFSATSSATYQYIPVASTSESLEITQQLFQPVSVFEDLAVVNGVFKLVSLSMLGPNFYAVP
jgi:hypothetical protein